MNGDQRELARRLATDVANELADEREAAERAGRATLAPDDERAYARQLISRRLQAENQQRIRAADEPLSAPDEDEVAREVFDRLYGLGRLQRYLDDPRVTDIHVYGHDTVWLKHTDGSRHPGEAVADHDAELVELIRTAAARVGRTERRFDAANPELNLQLPDGSRLFAVMVVSGRPTVVIRKHQFDLAFLSDLQERGTFDERIGALLRAAVHARMSLLIAGDIGSGKTTLLRALINEIPAWERLITVEDALELGVDRFPDLHPNVVTLESREPNLEGQGAIPAEQLVRMALRMDPDRVFVGEVRGAEFLPMLMAMSQGRDGSMGTIHSDTAHGVFERLQMYALLPPNHLDTEATARLAANALDLVVHLGKRSDGAEGNEQRFVTGMLEVREAAGADVVTNEVARPDPRTGRAVPTGAVHAQTRERLEAAGLDPAVLTGRW